VYEKNGETARFHESKEIETTRIRNWNGYIKEKKSLVPNKSEKTKKKGGKFGIVIYR